MTGRDALLDVDFSVLMVRFRQRDLCQSRVFLQESRIECRAFAPHGFGARYVFRHVSTDKGGKAFAGTSANRGDNTNRE